MFLDSSKFITRNYPNKEAGIPELAYLLATYTLGRRSDTNISPCRQTRGSQSDKQHISDENRVIFHGATWVWHCCLNPTSERVMGLLPVLPASSVVARGSESYHTGDIYISMGYKWQAVWALQGTISLGGGPLPQVASTVHPNPRPIVLHS
jgi:hypothetical protein